MLIFVFQDDAFILTDSLQAPLDIPIPEPPSPEEEVTRFPFLLYGSDMTQL